MSYFHFKPVVLRNIHFMDSHFSLPPRVLVESLLDQISKAAANTVLSKFVRSLPFAGGKHTSGVISVGLENNSCLSHNF